MAGFMSGLGSALRGVTGSIGKVPGVRGLAGAVPGLTGTLTKGGVLSPEQAAAAAGAAKSTVQTMSGAPRPTDPNLGVTTGSASQTTQSNIIGAPPAPGSPTPPGLPSNIMAQAQQAGVRARTRAAGGARLPASANAPIARTRPLSLMGY
jgi:hypothetical protein